MKVKTYNLKVTEQGLEDLLSACSCAKNKYFGDDGAKQFVAAIERLMTKLWKLRGVKLNGKTGRKRSI